jgi:hypothetical protein
MKTILLMLLMLGGDRPTPIVFYDEIAVGDEGALWLDMRVVKIIDARNAVVEYDHGALWLSGFDLRNLKDGMRTEVNQPIRVSRTRVYEAGKVYEIVPTQAGPPLRQLRTR